jgi:RNA 3'-terminal phosphate cyclase (ATP)
MTSAVVELDGSEGEGGGQILRSSLALSLLTGRPFHLRKARARRQRPGLQPQHLMSVNAAAAIGQAKVRGGELRSTDLFFEPGAIVSGKYDFMIGTAGATGLVLHTIYLPLALAGSGPSQLVVGGGTHVDASPCFHFLDITWLAYMRLVGIEVSLEMKRTGFYPRGGGTVIAEIKPCATVRGLHLPERQPVTAASGFSAIASLPEHVAERQARQARLRMKETAIAFDVREERWPGGPGSVMGIVLRTRPAPTLFFGLGARGKPAERVADEAVDQAIAYMEAGAGALDPHSADQVVLPLAFSREPSLFSVAEISSHLLTNIAVIRRFLDRDIRCEGELGRPGIVRIA